MRQLRQLGFVTVTLAILGLARFGHGGTIDDLDIESWSGTGSSEAVLMVDFLMGNDQLDSFAFGARFDGTITGKDLLDIVQTGDPNFSYTGISFPFGVFVSGLFYTDLDTAISYSTPDDWPNTWWAYYHSDDFGDTWNGANEGAGDWLLGDGDTDGWLGVLNSEDVPDQGPVPPRPESAGIPEPSTFVLAAVGAVLLLAWRRHRRGR